MLQYTSKNSTSLTKYQRSFTSESQFTSRWGRVAGFDKQIDRSHYDVGANASADLVADLTEQILVSYKTCGASEGKSDFMRRLAQESLKFLAEQRGIRLKAMQEESLYNQAVSELIENIYVLLAALSYQFNHTVGWNELYVTTTKPGYVSEILRYNKFREPVETVANYRARFSTRHVSLVVRGRKNKIEFLSLPVERVIGLSKAEVEYEPLMTLEASLDGDRVEWKIDGEQLTEERLDEMCLDMFAALIDQTKAHASAEHAA